MKRILSPLILSSWILLSLSQAAMASDPTPSPVDGYYSPVNDLCKQMRIKQFLVSGLDDKYKGQDYCDVNAKIPPEISGFMNQVLVLHQKAAAFLGMSLQDMIPQPFSFYLGGDSDGPYGSGVDQYSNMNYNVFLDWNGDPINQGIYLHELGHEISMFADPKTSKLPSIYTELAHTPLMLETVADLLALSVTGDVMDPVPGLPDCLQHPRLITDTETYHTNTEFFLNYVYRNMYQCCHQTALANQLSGHALSFCQYRQMDYNDPDKKYGPSHTEAFSPDLFSQYDGTYDIDPHQLGIPINSFLRTLGKQTHTDVYHLFWQALWLASATQPTISFECSIPKMDKIVALQNRSSRTLMVVFDKFRDLFSDKATYDRLWSEHGLDMLPQILPTDVRVATETAAQKIAKNQVDDMTTGDPTPFKSTGCWQEPDAADESWESGSVDWTVSGCKMACTQIQ